MTTVEQIQEILGVAVDNVWGPKSQAALIRASTEQKKAVQTVLGVTADGLWGPRSQAALNRAVSKDEWFECDASSFADPADVAAFQRCKDRGNSDIQCFRVGDNGIGQFGAITAQTKSPMIAVHGTEMKAKWGSIAGAAHRAVRVTVKGKTIDALVEDRISAPGRIDLNPACADRLGLKPPFLVPCRWRWV